jgi:hypothetical protein
MENQPLQPFWKNFGYAILGNLLFLLVYTGILRMLQSSDKEFFPFAVLIGSCMHAVAALLASIGCFIGGRKDLGAGFLLSAFVVPLIGFSICLSSYELRLN